MTNLILGMLADRALLRLGGDDVRGFLQGLIPADIDRLTHEAPLWTGLLTPQGKALFDFILWDDRVDILVDCEAVQADALAAKLSAYRLRRAVTIEHDARTVHWSPHNNTSLPDPRLPELGWRWLAPPSPPAVGYHAHRLSLGVTEGVGELGSGETLWLECNARELGGVDFTKGCYVGQENTARMHHRAKVNRRLVVAPIGEPGERTRAAYSELGLMVEHRRVDALGDALRPAWLEAALAETAEG